MGDKGDLILGIESSCDETAAAVVSQGRTVLASVVKSQIAEHAAWGGVVPEIAGRSHLEAMIPAVEEALQEAEITSQDLSAIAVTHRPGLLGSLLIGLSAAKAMAWAWEKPLIGIHHIEAHIYASLMSLSEWQFPYVTLVVSGGHTSLYRTDSPLHHELLGATRDDAAGEALDKAAKLLGLGYPGGPAMEKQGRLGNPKALSFKQPLLAPDSLEFSFSGLKTALLYTIKGPGGKPHEPNLPEMNLEDEALLRDVCASYEYAITQTLAKKCLRACRLHAIPRILVGGGVARNRRLRDDLRAMASEEHKSATFAAPEFCTDNAVMIAGLGHARWQQGQVADLSLDAIAR